MYGLHLISATNSSRGQAYFTYDGLGSTSKLTNSSATVTDTYRYDVFGALRSGSASSETMLFTGQQFDNDALGSGAGGLYYLRARHYDPTIGRFLTQDPLAGAPLAPQTLNRYPYVGNNPVNRVDPTGMVNEGGFAEVLFEEFFFHHCLELTLLAIALVALGAAFLTLPFLVSAGGLAGVLLGAISLFNFAVTEGAAGGIGYAAYEYCSERFEEATS